MRAIVDKRAAGVRHRSRGNAKAVQGKPASDRRIQRTHSLLHQALHALLREKAYDKISVGEILDRANVGRSTFYTHFHDKNELLISGIHDMLNAVRSKQARSPQNRGERIVGFSLPFFEYHHQHRHALAAGMGPRAREIIHGHLQEVLVELIAKEARKEPPHCRKPGSAVSEDLLARYIASTFALVLNWWGVSRNPLPPPEVDAVFRALVLPTLAATWR
ncbi:MAG TPA: TetR/AcrR family transcriptional regulator [Povalibacter sp.]